MASTPCRPQHWVTLQKIAAADLLGARAQTRLEHRLFNLFSTRYQMVTSGHGATGWLLHYVATHH